jgi:flagellar export protein FliJ
MKKFQFPLAQAMEWRRMSVHLEEAKLEALYAELAGLNARAQRLREARAQSEKETIDAASVTGAELKRLDAFAQAAKIELERLQTAAMECQKRIGSQTDTVVQKRRDVRLLERLHERKLAEWKSDFARELDKEAEELHLGRYAARYP